ncbi:TonB-dependent receptor plug domain-containing protein [Sphingobium aquiterrae]|uniref:TonB-dependent receptor plug domain-containing protein n=1 Tax=Sphingobium aquiterrae TaxID=2038656 RepID=UPI0030165189
MKHLGTISLGALAMALCVPGLAQAQDSAPQAPTEGEDTIIVTGTRTTGFKASDSPAPIQVLGNDVLKRTGQPDLVQSLAQNLPSVQAQAFGSDLQAHNLQMKLRGLSPNHTLILVNGKRRHGTANVGVAGGPYGGSAAPDISFVLSDSIDHVEVLQDGAAAQYGTDAIAGVINFIQKKADHGGSVNVTGGQYFDQGGKTYSVAGNIGLAPFEGAYLNITAEKKRKGFSFRGDVNPQVYGDNATAKAYLAKYPGIANLPYYPYTNRIEGDPQINQTVVSYNAGYEFGNFEVYSFGSYGHKLARANENVRTPDVIVSSTGVPLYPNGFQPLERVDETDYSITGGFKGLIGETTFDLASTYGRDEVGVYVENSGNAQLYRDTGFTPTFFHNGDFIASQWSNTLDLTHAFDVGLAGDLNVAAGLEYRRETYEIVAGDPASYYGGGAQSFFGYSPNDAGFHKRTNFSQYLDISVKPTDNWLIDGAVRHEHYSDFGDTTVFKLTSRYDFSTAFAVRGTVSTGFRAPTLGEGFYSGINVGPSSISGVLPSNDPAAAQLGFGGLKPEKSTNFSFGFVANPAPKLTITLDAYQIQIRDRIVISSSFYGFRGQYCPAGYKESGAFDASRCVTYNANDYLLYNQNAVLAATAGALGGEIPSYVLTNLQGTRNIDGTVAVQTFVNGVKMRTRGIDFMASYSSDFGNLGTVDWTLAANYNANKVQGINALPSALFVHPTDASKSALIDKYSVVQLEHSTPKVRVTGGAYWSWGKFSMNLRESFYSSVYSLGSTPGNSPLKGADVRSYVKSAFITDLELGYQIAPPLKLSIGANNLFNKYPTETSYEDIREPQLISGSRSYSSNLYPSISPYGINGGYYYGRIALKF